MSLISNHLKIWNDHIRSTPRWIWASSRSTQHKIHLLWRRRGQYAESGTYSRRYQWSLWKLTIRHQLTITTNHWNLWRMAASLVVKIHPSSINWIPYWISNIIEIHHWQCPWIENCWYRILRNHCHRLIRIKAWWDNALWRIIKSANSSKSHWRRAHRGLSLCQSWGRLTKMMWNGQNRWERSKEYTFWSRRSSHASATSSNMNKIQYKELSEISSTKKMKKSGFEITSSSKVSLT